MELPDTWICVWFNDGSMLRVEASEETQLQHLEWEEEPAWMSLAVINGTVARLRPSYIRGWVMSTPEIRARSVAIDRSVEQEQGTDDEEKEAWE